MAAIRHPHLPCHANTPPRRQTEGIRSSRHTASSATIAGDAFLAVYARRLSSHEYEFATCPMWQRAVFRHEHIAAISFDWLFLCRRHASYISRLRH
jgi:hypothetical protein